MTNPGERRGPIKGANASTPARALTITLQYFAVTPTNR
jgi:hypothetical protein